MGDRNAPKPAQSDGRSGVALGETLPMPLLNRFVPSLERELLRRGVGERIASGRRCADCRRTPLIGERVYLYEGGRVACELCRSLRREQPVADELVHGPAHGQAVRIRVRAAA